jgi:hypothetical protein
MRRPILVLSAVLALAWAGYSGYWLYTAKRLASSIGPWAEARRADGYTLQWRTLEVEGYPASFRLRFADAAVAGVRPLPFAATMPLLTGRTAPWDLKHWQLDAPQGMTVEMPGAGEAVTAAALDGSLGFGAPEGNDIDFTLHGISAGGVISGMHVDDAAVHLTIPAKPPQSHRDAAIAAAIRLAKITLPWQLPPFGSDIEAVQLAATVKGAMPSGPLRQSLDAWRADGGTVELEDGALRWGKLAFTTSGTLALDAALQPVGALTATIEDHTAIVDAAVASGNLPADNANFVKIFLGLMAKPGEDGKKRLTLPLSLQNDRIFLGPAQIARLPRFTWE